MGKRGRLGSWGANRCRHLEGADGADVESMDIVGVEPIYLQF